MKTAFLAAAVASLLATAGLSAIQGCSVSTGSTIDNDASDLPNTGDDDDNDAATVVTNDDAGDVDSGANACNQCLFDTCAAQNSACFANTDCTSLYQCALTATTTAAAEACATTYPAGACLYAQLSACDNVAACSGSCTTQCTGMPVAADCTTSVDTSACTTDGGTTTPPTTDAGVDVCSQCITANCGMQQTACSTGSDCDNYNKCVGAATTSTASDACATTYANGKTASEALATCSENSCASTCGS